MARRDKRKSKKPMDYSQRVSLLKARALTEVAQKAWDSGLRYKTIPLLLDALRRDPKNTEILLNLATACGKQRFYKKAEQYLDRLLELRPNKATIHLRVGQVCVSIDRQERAIECFQKAIELNADAPETATARLELARVFERSHRLDDARALVDETLKRDAANGDALLLRAIIARRTGAADQAEAGLRAVANDGSWPWHIAAQAWYELAQLLDSQGRFDDAYDAFIAAKQVLRPHAKQHLQQSQITVQKNRQLLDSLDASVYQRWHAASANESPYRLAVLTGHPRSGTTLVEQVLDSHEQLKSADEFDVFAEWIQSPLVRKFPPATPILTVLDNVPPPVRQEARATYFKQTEAIFDEPIGGRMLLDKNPGLTIMLPVMNWAFPEMKMLIALRDPRDVILSCFMQRVPLTPISSNWLSLEGAAEYYARVMQTWLKVRQLTLAPWLEFRYEHVVADLETSARKILDFLGLPWDDRVLKFYEHARAKTVRSPTYADVTQPVYKKAVGRWQNYARHLEPVMARLMPLMNEFGYA